MSVTSDGSSAWRVTAVQAGPGPREILPESRDQGRSWTPLPSALMATAAAVTAVPGAPGLVLAVAGQPRAAIPLLLGSAVIGLISIITAAAVRIHESRQGTRRLQIQHAGATALAQAMARCIDDAHATGDNLPDRQRVAEAATLRASAAHTVTEIMPAVLAVIAQQPPAGPSHLGGG